MENNATNPGLTTREALHILSREIEVVLHQFKLSQNKRSSKSWIRDSLHHSSQHTTINWISLCLLIWSSISLLFTHILGPGDYGHMFIVLAIFIIVITALSVLFELYDNLLRHNEMPKMVQTVLNKFQKEIDNINWKEDNYPSLFIPMSPCISLQWTFRDGKLVNLPSSLLVKDDIIFVRPGQISPAYCESLEKGTEQSLLHSKEVFSPLVQDGKDLFTAPRICKPLKGCKYRLLETPFLGNLRIMLEQALDKPITHHNHQRHILLVEMVQRIILPISIALFYGTAIFKYFYLKFDNGINLFLLQPTSGILPLLPLVFPTIWNLLNYFGMARFQVIFDETKTVQMKGSVSLEEEDTEHIKLKYSWTSVMFNFLAILRGQSLVMARTANILHVLGSVTALCCIDKKGVLSWPNPTAEKVFFLHNNESASPSSSLGNVGDLEMDGPPVAPVPTAAHSPSRGGSVEVLDLTHNHHDPFKLHFDDHSWGKHLSSLKPLGLSILLNTCNVDTEEQYARFCSHITCEALHSENLVPVTNRRCLCELAKQIGFVDQAEKIFSLDQRLSTFRHLQADTVRRDNKYARSLHISNSRLKVPFPHMFAVVVREVATGTMQLLSEGTADIVLDSCVDYWDGRDLCPLTSNDRKRIQDFYQRSSLTAYCTAFAYRPLNRVPTVALASAYLELPSDSKHLYMVNRSPTPLHWDRGVLEPSTGTRGSYVYSADSLLYGNEVETEETNAEGVFQMQCNQVFIGMVSMQYQVLTDMVHLIEQLERACIRFVHFSKENELRSRVFSEKMGLESGWNCHISLLSDRNSNLENSKAMSFSAPSAINVDQTTVRFDPEMVTYKHCSDQSTVNETKEILEDTPEMSMNHHTSHDWQSLSCLTDSTDQSAPIPFDMSNRAKLPRGIDKIRPHIELIDNVPLLVSLFTDCNSTATKEMLHIMQDYGEVICIIGSAANCDNTGIFMQADASVAVEPLYPQVCQKREIYVPSDNKCIPPVELARELNSLASSLSVKREDPISFYHLIMESRHFVTSLWNSVQFWICCCAVVSGVQLACSLAMLPSPLSAGQVLWLVCIVIPLLSSALIALPVDPEVMKTPLGKNNLVINLNMLFFIFWCYGLKFLPTVFVVLISYGGILTKHCEQLCILQNCTCLSHHTPMVDGIVVVGGWRDTSWTIVTARLIMLFVIVVHFGVISLGFVHRGHIIFRRSPHTNRLWLVVVFTLILIQSVYTLLCYNGINDFEQTEKLPIPVWVIAFAASSPLLIFLVNELVKRQEIRVNERFQKRARLDFGTKLGMNSPF